MRTRLIAQPSHRIHLHVAIEHDDPYPGYRKLHRIGAIFPSGFGSTIVCGHAAAQLVLKDPRFVVQVPYAAFIDASSPLPLTAYAMNFANGAEHLRRRGFMARAFQPRVLADFAPRMTELLVEIFRSFGRKKTIDVVADFARPFPVRVIAELLGVPRDAHEQCVRWSDAVTPLFDVEMPRGYQKEVVTAGLQFAAFMRDLMNQRRRQPRGDLITVLTQQLDDQAELSEDEVISNLFALFAAGHETTTNLLSSTFVCLHRHPDAARAFNADTLASTLEEVLRYESPLQFTSRIAAEDARILNVDIPKGSWTWIVLGAANRDPKVFPAADRFDALRSPNPHLAFGGGPHSCIGAALAKIETKHALTAFVAKYPAWRVVDQELEVKPTTVLRGWSRVAVKIR